MIYTSYFGNMKKLLGLQPNMQFINISGKAPDWFLTDFKLEYRKLAPKYAWWKEWHDKFQGSLESQESQDWYVEKYLQTVLRYLDPHQVKCDLYEMAGKRNVCILCHETPEKFCHRHLVSNWLREAGIHCGEYVSPDQVKDVYCYDCKAAQRPL